MNIFELKLKIDKINFFRKKYLNLSEIWTGNLQIFDQTLHPLHHSADCS